MAAPVVNLAARLADAAVPREVLVADDAMTARLGGAVRCEPTGRRTLRGFDEPVRVVTVTRR